MSGLMGAEDWEQIAEDLAAIRSDHSVTIVLRRGAVSLPAQPVRIVRAGGQGRRERSDGAAASTSRILLFGAEEMDVRPDDQFAYGGAVYTVVAPIERRGGQTAGEAEARQ